MTETLRNQKDITRIRNKLYAEQNGIDKLTYLPLDKDKCVLDHNHKTHLVRSVIHRQANAALGKIENIWTRYLSYWYPGTLDGFLRQCAEYISTEKDERYYHPKWKKAAVTMFNKMTSRQQNELLEVFNMSGSNKVERQNAFKKLTQTEEFDTIRSSIDQILKG